jgi:hypothetical protein
MKIVITGHTSGLGEGLYNHFLQQDHEVFGLSRINGFDISNNLKKIIEVSSGCDLFINNAYCGDSQLRLLLLLKDKVKNMIVCGSLIRKYTNIVDNQYSRDKKKLFELCELISTKENGCNILHLDLSFIHNPHLEENSCVKNYEIEINDIIKSIDFWLENPKITQIQFSWKMTDEVYSKIESICTNKSELENLKKKVNLIYEKYKI